MNSHSFVLTKGIEVGDFPTDLVHYSYNTLRVKPMLVANIHDFYLAVMTKSVGVLGEAAQALCDVDISEFTLGDFAYLLSMIDTLSFPKSPKTVTHKCPACGKLTTEILHNRREGIMRPKSLHAAKYLLRLKDVDWYCEQVKKPGLRFILPNLVAASTEVPVQERLNADPEQMAQWIAEGAENRRMGMHGITESYQFPCMSCRTMIVKEDQLIPPFGSITFYSEESVFAMKYNLMLEYGVRITDDTLAKELIYTHSAYRKDKLEAQKNRGKHAGQTPRNSRKNRR